MRFPTAAAERVEYREAMVERAVQRAADRASRGGRSLTCEHPNAAAHDTCVGNTDSSRCLCPCHDCPPVSGVAGNPEEARD